MAINVGVGRVFPGTGVSLFSVANNQILGVSIATGVSYYLPATTAAATTAAPLAVGVTAGRIRVKIYNGAGTSPVLTKLQLAATDGTNFVVFADVNLGTTIAIASTTWYDAIFDFLIDTASGSTNGGAVGQLINGGATYFRIVPTMTGTSPTFSMDAEYLGLI